MLTMLGLFEPFLSVLVEVCFFLKMLNLLVVTISGSVTIVDPLLFELELAK
jgi:hypothetical protein